MILIRERQIGLAVEVQEMSQPLLEGDLLLAVFLTCKDLSDQMNT